MSAADDLPWEAFNFAEWERAMALIDTLRAGLTEVNEAHHETLAVVDRLRVEVAQLCDDRDTFRQALVGIARAVRGVQAAENRGCSEDELEPFDNVYVEAVVDAVTLVPTDDWGIE